MYIYVASASRCGVTCIIVIVLGYVIHCVITHSYVIYSLCVFVLRMLRVLSDLSSFSCTAARSSRNPVASAR